MIVPLNTEQEAAAEAIQGNTVVKASPGSGKTTVLVNRYLRMISTHRINPADILNLTFTAEAAQNMANRTGLSKAKETFRTFHSLALDIVTKEKNRLPFRVGDFVLPSNGQEYQLLKDLMKLYPAITSFRSLRDKITEWKCKNISPEQAMEDMYYDKKGGFFYASAYRDYERKCREQGWLDFSSLMDETVKLLEVNPDLRAKYQKRYIAVDEAQDTDVVQEKLLRLLYRGNMFFVGDSNQCHPPGTLVDRAVYGKGFKNRPVTERVPIETLKNGNYVVSWNKRQQMLRLKGRKIKIGRRRYSGPLLCIQTSGGDVEVTPDHSLWVRFVKKPTVGKYFVYVMRKKGYGYRIGTSFFGNTAYGGALSHRCHQEKAEKAWILKTFTKAVDCRLYETRMSLLYGVPELTFQPHAFQRNRQGKGLSARNIKKFFSWMPQQNGEFLLLAHGLYSNSPLYERGKGQKVQKMHGWFKTKAANILPTLMEVPSRKRNQAYCIKNVGTRHYEGFVYSLDVDKEHTYVANGVPVANCIYEWRNAQAGNLDKFVKDYNAKVLYLGQNYRSTPEVVSLLKVVLPVDNGVASYMLSKRPSGPKPTIVKYDSDLHEAEGVIKQLTDLNHTAVLARTNRQLRTFQKACAQQNIRTMILGQKDLWQTNEVKHLLTLTKEHKDSPRPAHEVMTELMQQHNMMHTYRNTGGPNEKPPVENLMDIIKLSVNRGTVKEFLDWLRRLTFACEAAKAPGYEHKDKNPTLALSTVHMAKGKEWRNVFVIGCKQGLMPHKDGDIGEEKRIFFVAVSRAADRLQISYDGPQSEFIQGLDKVVTYSNETNHNVSTLISKAAEATKQKASAAELALGLI